MNANPDPDGTFDAFFAREHRRMVAAVAVFTGNTTIAQDVVDEAFVRALVRWRRVGRMRSPAAWVYRVAVNEAKRTARQRTRKPSAVTAETVDLPETALELWQRVSQLPPRQRLAVILRYVGDLSEVEIGEAMGIRRGTVSATLTAALQSLRRDLQMGYPTEESGHDRVARTS